ncbi:unnamed protein product [Zymoseptoria tritici ST99CH_1E4]|uniref:Uncharacterized protein n=1 Tax=Zymoseptoria tritici ST99CH_1E4 TaxID=1276532 RepID=A0A2H1H3V7_ZYMTR|nr:unnamed protein product [Zymoseptoria tritici ST99CH_1E4]
MSDAGQLSMNTGKEIAKTNQNTDARIQSPQDQDRLSKEKQASAAPSPFDEASSNSPHKPQPSQIQWKKKWRLPDVLLKNGSQWFYLSDRDQYAYYDYERSIWIAIDQAMQRWDTVGPPSESLETKRKPSPRASPSDARGALDESKVKSAPTPQSPQITKEGNKAWPLPEFLKNNGRQYTWAPARDSWVYYDIEKDKFAVYGRDLKRRWVAGVPHPETRSKRKALTSDERASSKHQGCKEE